MWKRLKRSKGAPQGDPPAAQATSTTDSRGLQPASRSAESRPGSPQHPPVPDHALLAPVDTSLSVAGPSSRLSLRSRLTANHHRQPSQSRKDDPLGLTVLYNPPERTLDVLFIHGLGGSSLRTWCHGRDLENLWPKLWLPDELPTARILTFGYNAHFSSREEKTSCTIGDFATDLLFRMKHGENTQDGERLGQVPIVIVAHSMGGLVFKKAFVQGQPSVEFADVISMIKAVVFLATPHHGSDLAETLNRALSSSVFGHSPKQYVAELARGSPTIDELNDSFRHHASKLQLFSFYETLATVTGPVSVMVVEKPSAVMGYPSEIPAPLAANHHDVCKFSSKQDPNYVSVVGALRSIAKTISSPAVIVDEASPEELEHLAKMLGVAGAPEEDLDVGRAARKEGTCEAFLTTEEADNWLRATSPGILWVHAGPGCGKSTVSSFVIEQLLATGHCCAYFYFKFGQRGKQSAASMVLSIAYQMAVQLPEFRREMLELAKAGTKLLGADAGLAWDKLFSRALARTNWDRTLYWVLDGLDEADSSRRVVNLLARVGGFRWPVRVLILSRPLPNIKREFEMARKKVQVVDMPLPETQHDIKLMVTEELNCLISSDEFKAEVGSTITTRSQGSFLWASLVTEKVVQCHREDQVRRVLDEMPDGMQRLYDRMTDAVLGLQLEEDKALARILLTWAMYAVTPVTVDELVEAYPAEFNAIMDINHTITLVCGQFVTVNAQGCLALVHHSAREHLQRAQHTPLRLDPEQANEELLVKCLTTLGTMSPGDSCADSDVSRHICYAALSWPLHLERSSPGSVRVLDALIRFFRAPCSLVWIQILAVRGRLSELLVASQRLGVYLGRRGRAMSSECLTTPGRAPDLLLLASWAVDLAKVLAKFARHLSERPAVIYEYIPALSPPHSAIHQLFGASWAGRLSISGLSIKRWDDCVARIPKGFDYPAQMAVSRGYLAVACDGTQDPTITLWDTTLLAEKQVFVLDSPAAALAFNHPETLLAACTARMTQVWRVADWSVHVQVDHPWQLPVVQFKFNESEDLVVIEESGGLYKLPAGSATRWELQVPALWPPRTREKPTFVTLNKNCTLVAVSCNPHDIDLRIWSVDPPRRIARLNRELRFKRLRIDKRPNISKSPIAWHPSDMVVFCNFGCIFKWSFLDNQYHEAKRPRETLSPVMDDKYVECSPDGQFFAAWDKGGSCQIYNVSSMTLVYRLDQCFGGIGFDPAGHRLYRSMGHYCDIWEPDFLQQFIVVDAKPGQEEPPTLGTTGPDGAENHMTWISGPFAEDLSQTRPQTILRLEPAQTARGLLVGQVRHSQVGIYDSKTNTTLDLPSTFTWPFQCFAWGPKHDSFAYSGYGSGVTLMSLSSAGDKDGQGAVAADILLHHESSDNVTGQLLFHASGNRLLVSKSDILQIISLPGGAVLAESRSLAVSFVSWLQHPSEPEYLLRFWRGFMAIISWDDLEQRDSISIDWYGSVIPCCDRAAQTAADTTPPDFEIESVLDSYSPGYILLRTVISPGCCPPYYSFYLVSTDGIFEHDQSAPQTDLLCSNSAGGPGKPGRCYPLFGSSTASAIGILSDNRLVFVDQSLWVFSVPIPHLLSLAAGGFKSKGALAAVGAKRHFFLPPDRVTEFGVSRCRLLSDGTVLCPVRGEVAIMKGDLMSDGMEIKDSGASSSTPNN